jgi:hypothetical protein
MMFKTQITKSILAAVTLGAMTFATTIALGQHVTLEEINAERSYHRAKEAVLWSQPAMGVRLSLDAIQKNGGDYNDIAYLSRPSNWKYQILTPNSVSLYVESVIRTSPNEPVVVEIPAVTTKTDVFGTIMDSFQVPLVDIGSSGLDKGEGGKYLILPASYDGVVPGGYIPVRSERHISFLNFRVIPASFSEGDLAEANQFLQQINIYPLNTPERKGKHIDVYDKEYKTVSPRDATYFDILTDFLNQETVVEHDLLMMGMMKSFGYTYGEAFQPSAETRDMLSKAVVSALDDLIIMTRDIAGPVWEGKAGWMLALKSVAVTTEFKFVTETEFAIDARAEVYSLYCCGPKVLGAASAYIYAARDMDGEPLDARSSYKLHVPANMPVRQFWSLTAYDAQTAVFFDNVAVTDLSSLDESLQFNTDGSIDLYVGPQAPQGKESNWIETNNDNNSIFLFRFYGPTAGYSDGSWSMDGFEKIE